LLKLALLLTLALLLFEFALLDCNSGQKLLLFEFALLFKSFQLVFDSLELGSRDLGLRLRLRNRLPVAVHQAHFLLV